MNETLALTKYVWTRYRIFLMILVPALVMTATLTPLLLINGAPQWLSGTIIGGGYLAVIFALIGSIVLFGFSRQSGLLDPKSGYDDWLMRLPISNWKFAIIPAGLLTCWIMTIWAVAAIVVRLVGGPSVPIVSQSLGMSSCAITACSLGWMPFRSGWQRLSLMIVALPLVYFVGLGVLIVSIESPEWMRGAVAGIVVCYIASLIFAVSSVRLARVSSFQQTKFLPVTETRTPITATLSRSFSGWQAALNWYDTERSRAARMPQILAKLAIIAILVWLVPLTPATAIFTMVTVAAIVSLGVSSRFEPTVRGARSSLPSYLLVSPLPSRAMAFVRLRAFATEYMSTMLIMTLLSLSCFAWQSNREAAWRWWSSSDGSHTPALTTLRMVAAIYLAILLTMLGISLRHVCIQLRGRQSIVLWVIAACSVALISPMIGFLNWFIQQRDWEHVTRVGEGWYQQMYQLLYVALASKLIFNTVVVCLARKRLFSSRDVFTVIAGWCLITVASSCAWFALWPVGHVPWTTVLMVTSLVIPLSVFFAGPLAVQANRHHRMGRGKTQTSYPAID